MIRTFVVLAAAAVLLVGTASSASGTTTFFDDFTTPSPLGSFSDCQHDVGTTAARCSGLRGSNAANWWAYPSPWRDTATQRSYRVGGTYDPEKTVWIDDGELHVRMFREANGPVHSAALVPKPLMNGLYGVYEERFRVSQIAVGYKSAHLLWPSGDEPCFGCEIDFPEAEWTGTIRAFTHPKGGGEQDEFDSGETWTDWRISRVEWTRGLVRYYLDGREIGRSTRNVPDVPMNWIIQNEAALDGTEAAPSSWAQLDVDWVRGTVDMR